MGTGYSRSPLLLKGALVELTSPFLVPIPNIILFQYNPETVSRRLSPWQSPEQPSGDGAEGAQASPETNSRAQPYDPEENLSLNLVIDATDDLEEPLKHPISVVTGVADRLAALEKLLYPIGGDAGLLSIDIDVSLGGASGSLSAEAEAQIEPLTTPVTLFVWGPGRVVPVRIKSFTVTEKSFNQLLYPVRAEVAIGLQVLTDAAFEGDTSIAAKLAKAAYKYTRSQQDILALANLANLAESVLGLLPL